MNNWKPAASKGGLIGLVITLISTGLLIGAIIITALAALAPNNAGVNFGTFFLGLLCFILLVVAFTFAYRTFNYYRMSYSLDRNALVISLGDRRQVIPMQNILGIVQGRNVLAELANAGQSKPSTPKPAPTSSAADAAEDIEAHFFEIEDDVAGSSATVAERTGRSAAGNDIVEAEIVEVKETQNGNGNPQKPQPKTTPPRPSINPGSLLPGLKVKFKYLTAWKGCYITKGKTDIWGDIQFYSTAPFEECLLLRTDKNIYAINPSDTQQFLIEYKLRKNLGPTEETTEGINGGAILNHPLWHDWTGRWLLIAGGLANLALFLFLIWRFPDLPNSLRIHFNKFGEVDRIGSKGDVLWLPLLGLIAWSINSILGSIIQVKERMPALLLYASTLIIQFAVWVAVLTITADRGT